MENTTTTPRKKRTYVKKRILTKDELWKSIVPILWVPFLHFCLEDWVDKIDFTREPDSIRPLKIPKMNLLLTVN